MPHLPSRPDDHDPDFCRKGVLRRPSMTRHDLSHANTNRPRQKLAAVESKELSCHTVNQGLHTLSFAGPEKTPSRTPPSPRPSLPMACSPCAVSDSPIKTRAHAPCSGLVQSIFSSPARLASVSSLLTPIVAAGTQKCSALCGRCVGWLRSSCRAGLQQPLEVQGCGVPELRAFRGYVYRQEGLVFDLVDEDL
jgi:hypothetical protein